MPKYIVKMCAKYAESWTRQYRAGGVKSVFSPALKESGLSEGKIAEADETRPKSRHYALRWFRVKEHAKKICFWIGVNRGE